MAGSTWPELFLLSLSGLMLLVDSQNSNLLFGELVDIFPSDFYSEELDLGSAVEREES